MNTTKLFDACILLSAISWLFIMFGIISANAEIPVDLSVDADVCESIPTPTPIPTPTSTPTPTPTPTSNRHVVYHDTFKKIYLNNISISVDRMEFEYIGDYYITAYCPEECGYRVYSDGSDNFPNGWITSTGTIAHREEEWWNPSTCGINTNYLSYGDHFLIDGKIYVAEDTGYVTMPLIDLFMPSYEQMMTHGSHWTDVYKVHYIEDEPELLKHFDINRFISDTDFDIECPYRYNRYEP